MAARFWSVTIYGAETRSQVHTDQNRAAIRSLFERPKPNPDGSFDIYFGPRAPKGKEDQWLKTIPGEGYWLIFRVYGPLEPAFDGTWKLDDLVEVQ